MWRILHPSRRLLFARKNVTIPRSQIWDSNEHSSLSSSRTSIFELSGKLTSCELQSFEFQFLNLIDWFSTGISSLEIAELLSAGSSHFKSHSGTGSHFGLILISFLCHILSPGSKSPDVWVIQYERPHELVPCYRFRMMRRIGLIWNVSEGSNKHRNSLWTLKFRLQRERSPKSPVSSIRKPKI